MKERGKEGRRKGGVLHCSVFQGSTRANIVSEEPHKPPEIVTCHSGPAALEPDWEHDRCDGFHSQLWSITLPMVGDLRDAFP